MPHAAPTPRPSTIGGFTQPVQGSFAEVGTPLREVAFVVVDLETTGGSPDHSRITEIGAVKLRAGQLLGEFHSLVNPEQDIPPSIQALTGITTSMVAARPPIEAVLPAFLEFCRGTSLVAHNARFDMGFLNAELVRLSYPRLANPVVCTANLARRLVRDEVRDCRLATLARHFRSGTEPVHRALADARATVDVFHGLLERAGSFGVVTDEDLLDMAKVGNLPLFKARRSLADGLPHAAGVYAFRSQSGEVLYVGKASDLRARVRSYFGSDRRRKIVDLLKEAAAVDHTVCPTPLEAAVREVRLIHAEEPRFNRRSTVPQRGVYVKMTAERFPRLSLVAGVRPDGATYLGPVSSRRVAGAVVEALQDLAPIRRCTMRIGPATDERPCALAELGRCLSPCDRSVTVEGYAQAVATVLGVMRGEELPLAPLEERMHGLAGQGRFEQAADVRDRLRALLLAVARARRHAVLSSSGRVAVLRPATGARSGPAATTGDGRRERAHELLLAHHGRLVLTATGTRDELERHAAALVAGAADRPSQAASPVATTPVATATAPAATAARVPSPVPMPAPAPALAPMPMPVPVPSPVPSPASVPMPVPKDAAEELDLVAAWIDGPGAVLLWADVPLRQPLAGGRQLAHALERYVARRGTPRPGAELAAKRPRRRSPAAADG